MVVAERRTLAERDAPGKRQRSLSDIDVAEIMMTLQQS